MICNSPEHSFRQRNECFHLKKMISVLYSFTLTYCPSIWNLTINSLYQTIYQKRDLSFKLKHREHRNISPGYAWYSKPKRWMMSDTCLVYKQEQSKNRTHWNTKISYSVPLHFTLSDKYIKCHPDERFILISIHIA